MPQKFVFRIGLLIIGCWVVASISSLVCAAVDANVTGPDWQWSPYSIGVCLVVDDSTDDADEIERESMAALMRWQSNWLNGICDFQPATLPDDLRHVLLKASNQPSTDDIAPTLESLLQNELPPDWDTHDKVFLAVISPRVIRSAIGWSLGVLEFDVRTRRFGEMSRGDVSQLSQLPERLFRGLTESLTPIAKVVRVDDSKITLEERAGELLAMQSVLPLTQSRQVLLPVTRTDDRDGNPRLIRRVDWTFLFVDKNANGLISTTLHTGLRSPINARMRPRHQQLALLARPKYDHSTIRLASYISRESPVPVCDILESIPGRKQAVLVGTTTPVGEFQLDYLPDRPVRLLFVRNGAHLIARLPIMPGVDPIVTAEIPVADSTLYAESLVLGIQEEVLDLVATRQILVSQAVTFRQRSDRRRFDETLQKLRRLKTQRDYISELNILRLQLAYDDPVSRRRIETMLDQTRTMVEKSLPSVDVSWTTK